MPKKFKSESYAKSELNLIKKFNKIHIKPSVAKRLVQQLQLDIIEMLSHTNQSDLIYAVYVLLKGYNYFFCQVAFAFQAPMIIKSSQNF